MSLKTIGNYYVKIIGFTNYSLAMVIAFTLAFPNKILFPLWTIWMVSWALEGRMFHWKNFSFEKYKIPLLLLGFFYLWHVVNLFFTSEETVRWANIERQISFLAMIPIVLFGVNKYYKSRTLLFSLIAGALFTTVAYYLILLYIRNYDLFVYGPKLSQLKGFEIDNYDILINSIKHRLYYCTVLLMALVAVFFVRKDVASRYGDKISYLFVFFSGVLLIYTLFKTGSRGSILAIAILGSIAIYRFSKMKSKVLISLLILIFLSILSITLYNFHPRMKNLITENLNTIVTGKADNPNGEPRLLIWHSALKHVDEYFWIGKGVGKSTEFLIAKYKEDNMSEVFQLANYGSHNQYLGEFIELGISGFLYLLLFFIFYHRFFSKRAYEFSIYFSVLIAFNLMTESMMGRLEGIIIICFMSLLIVWMQQDANKVELQ